jgi:hypothetical protein
MKILKKTLLMTLVIAGLAVFADKPPVTITLNDESYIDDIPFNTAEIAAQKMEKADLSMFVLKEEAYIDDIPFDTKAIAGKLIIDKSLTNFSLLDEQYIDDIPFNTERVAINKIESNEPAVVALEKTGETTSATIQDGFLGLREIIIPIIVILASLSFVFYEFVLS